MDLEDVRHAARIQLLISSAALAVSGIATGVAIASPSASRIWVGGFLVAAYTGYRSARLYWTVFRLRTFFAKAVFRPTDIVVIGCAACLLALVAAVLAPEYFRVLTPTVGTCWTADPENDEAFAPIACWSDSALFRTVRQVARPELCQTPVILNPQAGNVDYICLTSAE